MIERLCFQRIVSLHKKKGNIMAIEFDLNGWTYSKDAVYVFLDRINRHGASIDLAEWERFGGKVISLSVAQLLCQKLDNKDIGVPPWWSIDRSFSPEEVHAWAVRQLKEDTEFNFNCDFFLRSSSLEEDWLDTRSGMHESVQLDISHASEVKEAIATLSYPAVFQPFLKGVGVVLDVGHSSLLRSVVVRAAVGNINYEGGHVGYTSPTWDYRANLALFRETAEEIVSCTTHVFPQVFQMIQKRIPDLLNALRQIGIDFGVQIELVVHPEHPSVWWIVQVRPSPEMLRGNEESLVCVPDGFTLLSQTLRVNKPGVCLGQIMCSNQEYGQFGVDHRTFVLGQHCFSERLAKLSEKERIFLKGRIMVWEDILDHEMSFAGLRGAGIMGAEGQIACEYTFGNFAHSLYQKLPGYLKLVYEDGKDRGLIVGLPRDAWRKVFRRARLRQSTEILIHSDGLLAEAYWRLLS